MGSIFDSLFFQMNNTQCSAPHSSGPTRPATPFDAVPFLAAAENVLLAAYDATPAGPVRRRLANLIVRVRKDADRIRRDAITRAWAS
jgi:hypothetical protein